ncbi:DUF4214 domain-containing protein [Rubrivirga sp.]|uniref:DUF4214 domain-containing protein n=1 Tax=Rubrivirga sp. TaxID=1885344 RepID=UPI003C71991F
MAIVLSELSPREALTAIYIGYYDRAADPAGLAFWEDVVDQDGFNLVNITTLFASASETQARYPFFAGDESVTPAAFVTELYANLFNREPDMAGLEFWTEQLQNAVDGVDGALTVGEIVTSIIEGAQPADEAVIRNKIEGGLDFTDSLNAVGVDFDLDGATGQQARDVIDTIDGTEASLVQAKTDTDAFIASIDPGVPGDTFILGADRDNLTGTGGDDTFEAFNAELGDGDRVDGGSGRDILEIFSSEGGPAISPITTSIETVVYTNQTNDLTSQADNNVGGYSLGDDTVMVDVEIDAGRMSGVTRWEDYDSRADLVIEDARDQDDTDGTFTGDITVAMVSTDPGNVDYAVYFDQPVNTSQDFGTLEIRVLDQEAVALNSLGTPNANSTGFLTEASLVEFTFAFDGQPITVELADELGVTYGPNVSFQDLLDQVEAATQQALVDAGIVDNLGFSVALGAPVSVGVGNQQTLPLVLTFDVPADTIDASSDDVIVLGRDSGNNGATPSTDTFGAISTLRVTEDELIRLNVELDDVGKGSMGGDALFGAMSTGRQVGDDGTSDSIGIQQFDIEVDRSSQLQTINSTNNSLEVVNIINGENDGPNNTTTAADEMIGDLVVRGRANPDDGDTITVDGPIFFPGGPDTGIATDGPMPGGVPQHNSFGFSDVRVIDASAMIGSVDLTAELTEETVEKYLEIQDGQPDGEDDDVTFDYDLGTNDDEFLLNMSSSTLLDAGTGSREDFNLEIDGNDGDDVITTNVGDADKFIDDQGQDYYELDTDGFWYTNAVFNTASDFQIDGGDGDDVIWTHGWGDATIEDGAGNDVIYTDNSGVDQLSDELLFALDRNIVEHEQIDYVVGAAWGFNVDDLNDFDDFGDNITGATNDLISLGTFDDSAAANSGFAEVTVRYKGPSGDDDDGSGDAFYNVTVQIPFADLVVTPGDGDEEISVREQELNQAIKRAVNDDFVLSNLLEAVDGPGNSLVVYSKIDGEHEIEDLEIEITDTVINGDSLGGVGAPDGYDTSDGDGDDDVLFENFGSESDAESDNLIIADGDNANDLFVLSTNDDDSDVSDDQDDLNGGDDLDESDLNGASNETIRFEEGFGTDTIVNFDADDGDDGGEGDLLGEAGEVDEDEDVLDFSLITGEANTFRGDGAGNFTNLGGDVVLLEASSVESGSDSDSVVTVSDLAAALDGSVGDDATASTHIAIVYDDDGDDQNGGIVFFIEDGTGADDTVITEVGTINLIGTQWENLGEDNFA